MQQFNFSPLDFSRIPQQETQARQNWYNSWSNMASNIGKDISDTAKDVGTAIDTQNQRDLAEEWRQKQWNHQRWQEEDERKRREEQERLDHESAERLRSDFLGSIGQEDVGQYGPGAAFALSQIRHGRNYQDVSQGGFNLNNIIFQQRMLDAQRAERERERAEQEEESFVPNFIKDYDTRLAYENQVDFNKPEQTAFGYSMKELGTKYSNLMGEKEDLEALISSNPAYKNPEVVKRLNDLDAMTKILRRRIMAIRHPGETVF